jgi:hypothetical protein
MVRVNNVHMDEWVNGTASIEAVEEPSQAFFQPLILDPTRPGLAPRGPDTALTDHGQKI